MKEKDKFLELQRALASGDKLAIERAQRRLLISEKDEKINEEFIGSIKNKTLCKNLEKSISGNSFDYFEYAKMISSLITHCLIEAKLRGNPVKDYPIQELYIMLGEMVNEPDSDKSIVVQKFNNFVEDRYSRYF